MIEPMDINRVYGVMKRIFLPGLFLILLVSITPTRAGGIEALFAPKADPWPYWSQHDNSSVKTINHQAWDRFLKTYIVDAKDGINRVSYKNVSATDRQALLDYISAMQQIDIPGYNRNEQLAYWINLYNAVTVRIILDHYPVASIRDIDISPGLFSDGPWDKKILVINENSLSLNDIEHRILRPLWQDPRIHYAVNCASLGCPNLQKEAYTGAHVARQLDDAAREYVNHPRGVKLDAGNLFISSIYSWFQEDFGENDLAVIQHLQKYAQPGLSEMLKNHDFISGDDYDWSLNDDKPAASNLDSTH